MNSKIIAKRFFFDTDAEYGCFDDVYGACERRGSGGNHRNNNAARSPIRTFRWMKR